jgi:hypothetical protein
MAYDYLNPNYDEWGRQAIDRVNGVYAGAEDRLNALRQQTRDFNTQQQAGLNRDTMLRYADLQRSVDAGSADLAGQGIRPAQYGGMQLQALQNAANAQNTYQTQTRQMYENMANDRLAGIQQSRNAFQQGVWGDVHQAKIAQAQAAAAARASGGGGGGGGGGSSPSEILAIRRLMNADAPKVERGLDWLKTNYGNSGGRIGQVYQILQKTKGAAAQELMRKWGVQGLRTSTRNKGVKGSSTSQKMDYMYPQIMKMLQDYVDQRDRYHNWKAANPYTIDDAVAMGQQMGW